MARVVDIYKMDEYLLNAIDDLYRQIWNHSIQERLNKHYRYHGFKGSVCISGDEEIVGFVYGYCSMPGQYYHELLANELGSVESKRWLKDCFELVELAVHPSHRNLGYGKLLVTQLLKEVQNQTAILTTQVTNQSARKLYQGLGWEVVKEPFIPGNSNAHSPYVIMGKVLK